MDFLDYLTVTWMPISLWISWSQKGRNRAAEILGISVAGVIPTTNHLESFNSILKRKHIRRWQKGGHRVRFDSLIFLLVVNILPGIFRQREVEGEYQQWLSQRFRKEAGGVNLVRSRKDICNPQSSALSEATAPPAAMDPVAWWNPNDEAKHREEAQYIVTKQRIGDFAWLDAFTLTATCASSLVNISEPNHERYNLVINCYGWATCTCSHFQKGRGTCKHLWALRRVLPSMKSHYSFFFPSSETIARQILTNLFKPTATTEHGTDKLAYTPAEDLHVPPLNHLGSIAQEADETLSDNMGVSQLFSSIGAQDGIEGGGTDSEDSGADSDENMASIAHGTSKASTQYKYTPWS